MTPIVHITDKEQALMRENERLTDQVKRQSATIHVQAVAIQAMTEDAERLLMAAKPALAAMLSVDSTVQCEHFHHGTKDQQHAAESCPPLTRWKVALHCLDNAMKETTS